MAAGAPSGERPDGRGVRDTIVEPDAFGALVDSVGAGAIAEGLLDTARAVILLLDPQGHVVLFNRYTEELTGYRLDEVRGRDWFSTFLPQRDRPPIRGLFTRAISGGPTVASVNPILTKDGREVQIEWHDTALRDPDGAIVSLLCIGYDITDRKRAEAEIVSLSKFPAENPNPVLRVADDGTLLYANEAAGRLLASRQCRVGEAIPGDWQRAAAMVATPDASGRFEVECEARVLSFVVMPVPGAGYVNWYGRDITEQRRAQEALREAKRDLERRVAERTRELAATNEELQAEAAQREEAQRQVLLRNALLSGINRVLQEALAADTDVEVARACLSVAEELTGSKFGYIGELNRAGLFDMIAFSNPGWDACSIPRDEAARLIQGMPVRGIDRSTMREGRSRIVNDPAHHPDRVGMPEGHPPVTCFLGVPLKRRSKTVGMIGLANKPGGYEAADQEAIELLSVAFLQALTHKRAEQMIVRLNRDQLDRLVELAALNKEFEAFSYSVSHDLRAPLRAMDGFSRLVLQDYAALLDEKGQHYLERIRAAGRNMGALIDDLLSLSRITRDPMRREPVDLSKLAREVADALRVADPHRVAEFSIADGVLGYGDERLIRIALENLLGNAWKFTSKHPTACIEFGVERHEGEDVYFVRDDGAGFDMAYADKLFAPFQRVHTTAEFPGTGVGLAMVQRVIHRHGRRVWAEGETERGATFYFTLPAQEQG